jgi:hypothetical protein
MPSGRLEELVLRIKELRRLLLPSKFDPTGTYKDPLRVTTRALSFRVLAHAEVETYLEDRALDVATTALKAWEEGRHVSIVTLHLVAFGGMDTARPPDTLTTSDPQKQKDWAARVEVDDRFGRCVSDFYRRVSKENHGIKEKNILEMFIPIGFDMSKCEPLFLQTMSSFGESRGTVAHTSGKGYVQKGVDPKDEYQTLEDILAGLGQIDLEFDRLILAAKVPIAV